MNKLRYFVVYFLLAIGLWTAKNYPQFLLKCYHPFSQKVQFVQYVLMGEIPFSVGDALYAVLALEMIFLFVFKRISHWAKFRECFFYFSVFLLIFYTFWGLNYYKPTISKTYPSDEIKLEELKSLASFHLNEALAHQRKKDQPFSLERNPIELQIELKLAIEQLNNKAFMPYSIQSNSVGVKQSLYGSLLNYLGVLGYYNPFTGEAQFNHQIPDIKIPFTLAHEMSHQMGVAPENEANFVAYLVLLQSENSDLRYALHYKALKSLLSAIAPTDSLYVQKTLNSFTPGMKKDLEEERAYAQQYQGVVEDAFSTMNNFYLRSNGQTDGVESYAKFIHLVVGFHRKYPIESIH